MSDEPKSELEELEALREERKAEAKRARDAQKAIDLKAIMALEEERGASNVVFLEVGHTPGLPVLVAARCPDPAEVKKYRSRLKPNERGIPGDPVRAHEEVADQCRIYPDAELYAEVCKMRAGVHAELGAMAVRLAAGKEEAQGKG